VSIFFTELILTFDIRTVLDTKQKELVGLKQQHETKTQEIGKTNEVIKKLTADIAAKDVEIKNFHEKIKVTQEYVLGGL
jgi:predicted  nucleic acid-binding Zn-ribbon protein